MKNLPNFAEFATLDSNQSRNLKVTMVYPEDIHLFARGVPSVNNLRTAKNVHNQFMLFCCLQGKVNLLNDHINYQLTENKVALVFPGQPHIQIPVPGENEVKVVLIRFSVKNMAWLPEFRNKILNMDQEQQKFFREFCESFHRAYIQALPIDVAECSCRLALLLNCLRKSEEFFSPLPAESGVRYIQQVYRIFKETTPMPTLAEVAEKVGISDGHLRALFRRYVSKSPHVVWDEMRLRKAQTLLCHSNLTIGEIAQQCCFGSIYSFSRFFSHSQGLSPSSYRHQVRHQLTTQAAEKS